MGVSVFGRGGKIGSSLSLWQQTLENMISTYVRCNYTIGVVGPSNSGKSCIISQYISNQFVERHDETIEEIYSRKVNIDINSIIPGENDRNEISCELDIIDTCGRTEGMISDAHLKNCDGFVIVGDCTDAKNFSKCLAYIEYLKTLKGVDKIYAVMAHNKMDLLTTIPPVLSFGLTCPLVRVSAKSRQGIDEIFDKLICEIIYGQFVSSIMGDSRMKEIDTTCTNVRDHRKSLRGRTPTRNSPATFKASSPVTTRQPSPSVFSALKKQVSLSSIRF
jgi:small GTP-binding protein